MSHAGCVHLDTDVLVIGSGAAGMTAALAAANAGSRVIVADRSLIGRGGATIMAQMTVAVALGERQPDHWQHHLADTLSAGRGLCDVELAGLMCEHAPAAIRQLDEWRVGWARGDDGKMLQVQAPGHDKPRCVYVDFLATGPALAKTLRGRLLRHDQITRIGDLCIVDLSLCDGEVVGAAGFSIADGRPVSIASAAVVLATGGLTRIYQRSSASANMCGDGHALALRAGAELVDMEFVQFFPIGHLSPRLVGMDPIMWDPFRYKLGGRLLNADQREFMSDYGDDADGAYLAPRDEATRGILAEVRAGRGSPTGGVYLSFQHVSEARLREAFGPVIDRLAANGIDLTKSPVEVAPIAHYHMGGVRVGLTLETRVRNLFAAGEIVGGANGANRLSGNAITEALVFGRLAGEAAARRAKQSLRGAWRRSAASDTLALVSGGSMSKVGNFAACIESLQAVMTDNVGPIRTREELTDTLEKLNLLKSVLGTAPPGAATPYNMARVDWFDLRSMLVVAEAIARAALARDESRGAHQRSDFPVTDERWSAHQLVSLRGDAMVLQTRATAES